MSMIDERLMQYLANRWDAEDKRVLSVVGAMNPRERKLVREAAIMGFVRGKMAGRGGRVPDGSAIVAEVVSACLSMPDIYRTFDRMERTAVARAARAEQ